MGKATFKGLQTDPLSNESFVLLGGPLKKPSKQNSKDEEVKDEPEDDGRKLERESSNRQQK